jgi:hypothetical protein
MRDREDFLEPFIKFPSVAANNNTRLASGVLRRKNKLEGVVQKRIARIIAITHGLSRRKTLYTALHSRKVLAGISYIGDQNGNVSQSINYRWQIAKSTTASF